MNREKLKEQKETTIFYRKLSFLFGGPEGARTLDLTDANRTLSQLSYGPIFYNYITGDKNCKQLSYFEP